MNAEEVRLTKLIRMSASRPSDARAARSARPTAMRVAADLRRRILPASSAPGQRLKLDDLATLCDVSHMPVREALRELEGEGVLEVFPHRGAVIKGVDERFVRNFYDVRAAIEGMLTERCAERIDAARHRAARRAGAPRTRRRDAAQTQTLLVANRELHDTINAGGRQSGGAAHARAGARAGRCAARALRLRPGPRRQRRRRAPRAAARDRARTTSRRPARSRGGIASARATTCSRACGGRERRRGRSQRPRAGRTEPTARPTSRRPSRAIWPVM